MEWLAKTIKLLHYSNLEEMCGKAHAGLSFLTFVLALLLVCFGAKGQEISFKHIGTQEGLSQSSVSSIVQDTIGRIWMGTRNGLNLFDGSFIKSFHPIRGDSTSLYGHFITDIVKDGEYLWVISKSGISRLRTSSQRFDRFEAEGQNCLIRYKGEILLGTNEGLFVLDGQSKSFKRTTKYLSSESIIQDFYIDDPGNLWMCTNEGLFIYYPALDKTKRVLGVNTTSIFIDSNKRIWAGTYNNGVYLLAKDLSITKHFKVSDDTAEGIISNTIRDIEEDASGNIWVGTFLGLSIIYPDNKYTIQNLTHNEDDVNSLSHNSILCITKDKQGGMWLGTYFGGVNYYHADFNIFKSYPKVSEGSRQESLGFNVIGEITEADNGELLIATEGGGVDKYIRTTETFHHYRLTAANNMLNRMNINVKALQFVDEDTILVGTHLAGLKKLNIKTGAFKTYLPASDDSSSIPSNIIEEIIPYKKDIFLLGTKEGVVTFNTKTEKFSYFIYDKAGELFNKRVNCLLIDRFGVLWIGTMDEGLFSYDPETEELKTYLSSNDLSTVSSNNISFIYEDHYFRLWFGTHGGGLNLYDRENDSFRSFNVENSDISSNFIQGIEKSRQGNLWVSTSKGLSLFDFNNKRFYNYSNENGFPLKEPNHRSIYLTSTGELFVGGIDGLVSFKEKELFTRENNFNLVFSSIEVNGQLIKPNDSTGILKRDFAFTDSIELSPNQQFFTIQFSACNYVSTKQYNYRYKLEQGQTDWINIQNQNSLTFSKLLPGRYNLRVQAISNDVEAVIDEAGLIITVLGPWYSRWYAIIGYTVLIILVLGSLLRMYRARIQTVNALKSEQREKEQIQQLNQAKLQFFTNISHEFKTPLTIIMGLLETVSDKVTDKSINLQKVRKSLDNVYRLDYLVNELLDFRRLEIGRKSLKLKEHSFNNLIRNVFDLFSETAKHKMIKFELHLPSDDMTFLFDYRQLEKVFFNLLSNAFKFVKEQEGSITVEMYRQDERVITLVRDNGSGIGKEDIEKIFDPYYRVEQGDTGTFGKGSGIGLAISKEIVSLHGGSIMAKSVENEYTEFRVEIPIEESKHENPPEKEEKENSDSIIGDLKVIPNLLHEEQEISDIGEQGVSQKGNARVLIVEDNKEVQNLIIDIIKHDYDIVLSSNGKEGLEMAVKESPDVIITDVMMPEMSGTEMCAVLKRNIETCHIPVILLTARSSVEAQLEGFACGADIYVPKPFHADILKVRIKNVLRNRELVQNRFRSDPNMEIKEVVSNTVDEQFLEKAKTVVEENIENSDFSVQDFAEAMWMGKSKFYAKIKNITGQTPNEFILSNRLKKAALYLMKDGDITVSEVAYRVGYKDPRYFSKSFRQYFGVSPSIYGKAGKEEIK